MATKTACTRCGAEHRRLTYLCSACEQQLRRENLSRFGRAPGYLTRGQRRNNNGRRA